MRSLNHPPLHAVLAVAAGFALMSLGLIERTFGEIAVALAAAGGALLDALGHEVVRRGGELRDPVRGVAVAITNVCDGHGILIGWAGVLFALERGWQRWLAGLAAGFAAIQLFNLVRVVVLYLVAALAAAAFEIVHYYVFPLLTALLIIGFAAAMFETVRRRAALAIAVTLAVAVPWYFVADAVGAALVPLSNALLSMFGPVEVTAIAERTTGWVVETRLVDSVEPLRLRLAPLTPSDFVLAAPVLAGAAVAARGGWLMVAAACAAMVVTMALAAVTYAWGVAISAGTAQVALPAGAGLVRLEPYGLPSETATALVALAQNVLVHLNLLVLPALILGLRPSGRHA